jgi:hypothetical protein
LELINTTFEKVFNKKPRDDAEKEEQRTTIVTRIEILFNPAFGPPQGYKEITTVNQVFNFVFTKLCENISDPKKLGLMKNNWRATYKENMCPSEEWGGGEEWNGYLDEVEVFFRFGASGGSKNGNFVHPRPISKFGGIGGGGMRGGDNSNEDPNTPEMLVARLVKEGAREVDEARPMDGDLMTEGGQWESRGGGGGVILSGRGRGGTGMGDGGGMRSDTVSTGASLALASVPESHIKKETNIRTSSSFRAGSSGEKSSQLKAVLDVLRVRLQSPTHNDLDLDPETFTMFISKFDTLCEETRMSLSGKSTLCGTTQTASGTSKGTVTLCLARQEASWTSSRAPSTSEGCSLPADTSTLCPITKSATSTASVPSAFFPTSTSLPSSSCVC